MSKPKTVTHYTVEAAGFEKLYDGPSLYASHYWCDVAMLTGVCGFSFYEKDLNDE